MSDLNAPAQVHNRPDVVAQCKGPKRTTNLIGFAFSQFFVQMFVQSFRHGLPAAGWGFATGAVGFLALRGILKFWSPGKDPSLIILFKDRFEYPAEGGRRSVPLSRIQSIKVGSDFLGKAYLIYTEGSRKPIRLYRALEGIDDFMNRMRDHLETLQPQPIGIAGP